MMTRYENGEWNTYFYLRDHLGSVMGIVDDQGNIVETYSYSPYGEPSLFDSGGGGISGSLAGNRFMYTGREYDLETGIYCYRFRYYDPESHRFLSIDPIGIAGGLNVYGYVAANPQMLTDPFGFSPLLLDKNFWGAFPGEMLRTTGEVGVSALNFWPSVFGNDKAYARTINYCFNGQITRVNPCAKTERTLMWVGLGMFEVGSLGALGSWAWVAAGNPTMEVIISTAGNPFHVMYGTSGEWVHATGTNLGSLIVKVAEKGLYSVMTNAPHIMINGIPIMSKSSVLKTGQVAWTCIGAACRAWIRGITTL